MKAMNLCDDVLYDVFSLKSKLCLSDFGQHALYMRCCQRCQQLGVTSKKYLRDNSDSVSLPEESFKRLYRLCRGLAHWLLQEIGPYMRENERTTAIPIPLRVSISN